MPEITMPRLSDTMQEGTIASWLKKPGDSVDRGEVIAQIETDKATMDLTAWEAGTLQEILAPEGATVAIGAPVARMEASQNAPRADESAAPEASGEGSSTPSAEPTAAPRASGEGSSAPAAEPANAQAVPAEKPAARAVPAPPAGVDRAPAPSAHRDGSREPAAVAQLAPTPAALGDAETGDRVRASPMARHIAAEHGLDIASVRGSGPRGRVIRSDVEAALARAPSSPPEADLEPPAAPSQPENGRAQPPALAPAEGDERVPLSQMRRIIARRMAESTRTIPHFFLTVSIDATELVQLRTRIVQQLESETDGVKVSLNDLIVKSVALAARRVPEVNVSFDDDALIKHAHVNVGVAVATPRGLLVPVIRDADQKSVGQIAREVRDLAGRAKEGKLQPPEYAGGTITVSNLGMFGVEQFNAVINPPEAAILAVGAVIREPAEFEGAIALRDRLHLTLSVDHRALDGAAGARYLQALRQLLEHPLLLLV